MTIDEAIRLLRKVQDRTHGWSRGEWEACHQLGIEALQVIRALRKEHPAWKATRLPGETEK